MKNRDKSVFVNFEIFNSDLLKLTKFFTFVIYWKNRILVE